MEFGRLNLRSGSFRCYPLEGICLPVYEKLCDYQSKHNIPCRLRRDSCDKIIETGKSQSLSPKHYVAKLASKMKVMPYSFLKGRAKDTSMAQMTCCLAEIPR